MSFAVQKRQRALDQARRAALAKLGCEFCGATKDEIRDEQHRLKAEFLARQASSNGLTALSPAQRDSPGRGPSFPARATTSTAHTTNEPAAATSATGS